MIWQICEDLHSLLTLAVHALREVSVKEEFIIMKPLCSENKFA